jgi:hypothetical protein
MTPPSSTREGNELYEHERLFQAKRDAAPDLYDALFAIADGEGDPQVIARQTIEAAGLPLPRGATA